jgi:hypothetical protein
MTSLGTAASVTNQGLKSELVTTVQAIPPDEWRALAPRHDPLWTWDFFRSMEEGNIGPDGFEYVVLRDRAGRLAAVLPMTWFSALRLDDMLSEDARQSIRVLRVVLPSLFRIRALFCGNPLGEGRVLVADWVKTPIGALLVRSIREVAARRRLGWIVCKDFSEPDLARYFLGEPGSASGLFQVPGLPDAILDLPGGRFDEYVAGLAASARRNVRSKVRKLEERPEFRMEVVEEFSPLIPQMMPLYQQVFDKAETKFDHWTPDFFRSLAQNAGVQTRVIACWEDQRLVGFMLCLFEGTGSVAIRIGLDYARAREARLYHNLQHQAVRLALLTGCRQLNLCQTAYEPKRELGCRLHPLAHAVGHRNPLLHRLLRRVLPAMVNLAGAEADRSS